MKQISLIFLLLTAFSAAVSSQTKKIESVYTSLGEKFCRIEREDLGYIAQCPGIAGYRLEVDDHDDRQTLNIISPSRRKYELDLFHNVSPGFSWLGEKVEWRARRQDGKITPFALIVWFNVQHEGVITESYLVVAKVTPDSACITDLVKEPKNQNLTARELADNSTDKPCLALAKIPSLIERLANKDEYEVRNASDFLIRIGPAVVAPLVESLKQQKLCEFQFAAAEVIKKLDNRNPALKPALFDLAAGRCEYRYAPEKYLPDANAGSVISIFNAAQILATEIDGGVSLLPELMKTGGVGFIGGTRAFGFLIGSVEQQKKKNQTVKPEIISAMKAAIPLLVSVLETEESSLGCDSYELVVWMRDAGLEELSAEANQALQGKTVKCKR